jgi:hypothetical protein
LARVLVFYVRKGTLKPVLSSTTKEVMSQRTALRSIKDQNFNLKRKGEWA